MFKLIFMLFCNFYVSGLTISFFPGLRSRSKGRREHGRFHPGAGPQHPRRQLARFRRAADVAHPGSHHVVTEQLQTLMEERFRCDTLRRISF